MTESIAGLTTEIVAFRDARDWKQFHEPRNLAASISIEAGELLEIFQWNPKSATTVDAVEKNPRIEEELADVAIYVFLMAHDLGIDLPAAIRRKLESNARRYPIGRSRGSSAKCSDLGD